jgi:hypothetical protein
MAKRRGGTTKDIVKTTIELPADLWRAAKMRAVDERSDLRRIIIEALRAHLTKKETRR